MDLVLFTGAALGVVAALHVRKRRKERTIVPNEDLYAKKVRKLTSGNDAIDNIQLILDFDRTITTFYYDKVAGTKGASCHGIVEHEWDGARKARAEAFNAFYYPIEVDIHRTVEEKIPFMEVCIPCCAYIRLSLRRGLCVLAKGQALPPSLPARLPHITRALEQHTGSALTILTLEYFLPPSLTRAQDWYRHINELIIQSGLTHTDLLSRVASAPVKLRPGVTALLEWAAAHGVPVTVFSAGITNVAEEVLRQLWRSPLPSTLRVVSNEMVFHPDTGLITGFKEPLLHMFNKVSTTAEQVSAAWMAVMRGRRHVLLIGDGLGDAAMADGLHPGMKVQPRGTTAPATPCEAEMGVLRVGLCNVNVSTLLPQYCALYDMVITEDGPLDEVLALVRTIPVPVPL